MATSAVSQYVAQVERQHQIRGTLLLLQPGTMVQPSHLNLSKASSRANLHVTGRTTKHPEQLGWTTGQASDPDNPTSFDHLCVQLRRRNLQLVKGQHSSFGKILKERRTSSAHVRIRSKAAKAASTRPPLTKPSGTASKLTVTVTAKAWAERVNSLRRGLQRSPPESSRLHLDSKMQQRLPAAGYSRAPRELPALLSA